jgi:hypothetical protein
MAGAATTTGTFGTAAEFGADRVGAASPSTTAAITTLSSNISSSFSAAAAASAISPTNSPSSSTSSTTPTLSYLSVFPLCRQSGLSGGVRQIGLDSRADLQQYLKPIFLMLLTRMPVQTNKTDKFLFMRFILYTLATNKEGFTPDQIVEAIEEIQSGFVILDSLSSILSLLFFSPLGFGRISSTFVIA